MKVSACIICCNQATRLSATLDSLAWCGDIVVVDSGSTDGTVELATAHSSRPRVLHHDWAGYSAQRKFAAEQCKNDWVLMLDADEECSPELAEELERLGEPALASIAIGQMPRRNYLAGRYIRCWSPDWQARLIHKGRTEWDSGQLPEVRRPLPGFGVHWMRGWLLHGRAGAFTPQDLVDGVKMASYAELLAGNMARRGKRATLANLLFRPVATFLKYYIFRGGILDGRLGLVIAYKTTIGVMLKYTALYAKEITPDQANGAEG